VLDEISGPTGKLGWIRAILITSDNICHIKSVGVASDCPIRALERPSPK
jgi:hypothetical protein